MFSLDLPMRLRLQLTLLTESKLPVVLSDSTFLPHVTPQAVAAAVDLAVVVVAVADLAVVVDVVVPAAAVDVVDVVALVVAAVAAHLAAMLFSSRARRSLFKLLAG